MQIGFTGTGGTGKTSILNYLTAYWKAKNITLFPSVMRGILQRYGCGHEVDLPKLPLYSIRDIQINGFYTRREKEEHLATLGTSWVSDRTLLDHYAYLNAWTGAYYRTPILEQTLLHAMQYSLAQYDHIFYFNRSFWEPRYERIDNPTHHDIIEMIITKYLKIYTQDPNRQGLLHYIPAGSIQERAEFVMHVLDVG